MIYQISLRIQMMEDKWVQLGEEHKMQWSNRDLVSASCGWTALNEEFIGTADSVIPMLEKGILELTRHEPSYSTFEAMHGLGTIKEVLSFYRNLLNDCKDHPFTELYGYISA